MVRRSKAFALHLRASRSGPSLPFLRHCPLPPGSLLCNSTKRLRVCEYTGHAITTEFLPRFLLLGWFLLTSSTCPLPVSRTSFLQCTGWCKRETLGQEFTGRSGQQPWSCSAPYLPTCVTWGGWHHYSAPISSPVTQTW